MEVKEEMISLAEKLKIYQDTYYKEGKSLVSDSEYDRLTDRLIALEKEFPEFAAPDSPTKRVGSDLTNDFPEVQHTIPVLSLEDTLPLLLQYPKAQEEREGWNLLSRYWE